MMRQLFLLDSISTVLMHNIITTEIFHAKKYIVVKNDEESLKLLDSSHYFLLVSEASSRFYVALSQDKDEECVYINVWITGQHLDFSFRKVPRSFFSFWVLFLIYFAISSANFSSSFLFSSFNFPLIFTSVLQKVISFI